MILPVHPSPLLLSGDGRGGIRVGASLSPLDILIQEYQQGADPEGIVHAYPVLDLADVYAVIAYYLGHRAEETAYLQRREAEVTQLRREIESRQPAKGDLRAKLLARRASRQEAERAASRD